LSQSAKGENMSKLYEILAVEGDLRKKTAEMLKGITALFGQPGKFTGLTIGSHVLLEGEPEIFPENTDMAFTVKQQLSAIQDAFGGFVDVTLMKELTNTEAFGDVVLGEINFLTGLSATALLNLESRLDELLEVYKAIPVLDATERWHYDEGQGCYVSDVRSSYRMKKVPKPLILAPATVEHPAQVQVFQDEIPAYKVEKVIYSGMLTLADKQARLDRLSKLATAVKKARQRANDVEIKVTKVASKIFDYINNGDL